VRLFVDAARVLALAKGLRETNTADRLRAVRDAGGLQASECGALVDAFYFVQALRLQGQSRAPQTLAGGRSAVEDLANRLDPDRLNGFEQSALKEAFRLARQLQSRVELDFHL